MKDISDFLDKLIVGDALEILREISDSSIDIVVTSPPYNKRDRLYGWLVSNENYSHYQDKMPQDDYEKWQIDILNQLYRLAKPGGSLFYNHKIRWEKGKLIHPYNWVSESDWTMRQEIIWDRILAANVRGWRYWQIDERIYWLYKPIKTHLVGAELESKHAKLSSIWRISPAPRSNEHPAPFPLQIPVRAIFSMPGEEKKIVLDPFCGSGTTLIAAKILGHHYIGIDISPRYIETATKRLANWKKEIPIVEQETKKHVVNDPFKDRKKRGTVNWPFRTTFNDNST